MTSLARVFGRIIRKNAGWGMRLYDDNRFDRECNNSRAMICIMTIGGIARYYDQKDDIRGLGCRTGIGVGIFSPGGYEL